jgi:probable F420-dependent oxidoreductase
MTEVAGEVADGLLIHAFTTERYVREVTLPALERGAAKAGRTLADIEISGPAFVVTGTTEEEMAASVQGTKQQIAFYGSTPAYRPVLDLHGWGDLQDELRAMTKRGQWDEMSALISDELVDAFAVVGTPEEAVAEVKRRYGDIATRITLQLPEDHDEARWRKLFDDLRS